MDIGLFQLENLIHSQVRFCFLDLRREFKALPPPIETLTSKALRLAAQTPEDYLKLQKHGKEAPVILLSEDGKSARAACDRLEAGGFLNVYVIEGGVEGLLADFAAG